MNKSTLDPRIADLFELPQGQCYLLAHSLGCQPKKTRAALESEMLDIWAKDPQQAWPRWIEVLMGFRQAIAGFLGGQAKEYCPQVNVSSGFSKALGAAWPQKDARTLLMSEADFPSLGFVAQCAQRQGWTIEWLSADLDQCDANVWASAMHPKIDAVLATHVQYSTNRRSPVSEICALAKERGILSILDICQSAGVVPIDLPQLGADLVVGSCLKWICGGPGAGFIWVNPDPICALEPVDVGWFSHQDPFEFQIHNFHYAEGADRFTGGTPSILPFVSATVGLQTLDEIGIEAIRAHNLALTQVLRDAVSPSILLSDNDPTKRGGTTVIALTPEDPRIKRLQTHNIAFDSRKFGIRLSPHVYTSREQIEQVAELLKE